MILSDLHSMTGSVMRSPYDSWASCYVPLRTAAILLSHLQCIHIYNTMRLLQCRKAARHPDSGREHAPFPLPAFGYGLECSPLRCVLSSVDKLLLTNTEQLRLLCCWAACRQRMLHSAPVGSIVVYS